MPMYEYRCGSCGEVFEIIRKFSDEALETHPGCGGPVQRLVSAAALRFKGSGWYVNDYARKNGGNGKSEAAKTETPASDPKKTEPAKTEAKTDKK